MKTKFKAKKEEAKAPRSLLRSGLCAALVVSLALMAFTMTASADVINVPGNQATIQAAINAVDAVNRTIEVDATTYSATETVDVNKSNIIIRSINGRAVVSAGGVSDHVFNITDQRNVTLDNFTIRDAHGTSGYVAAST